MSDHPKAHEDLLQAVIVGDLDPSRPEVRERLEGCPVCRKRLEEVRGIEEALEATDREAEELARLAAQEDSPVAGEQEALKGFRTRLAGDAGSSGKGASREPRRSHRFAVGVIGVAAAVVLWVILGRTTSENGDDATLPDTLGDGPVRCETPLGEVSSYDRFAWSFSGAPGASYDLRIYDLDGRTVFKITTLTVNEWIPTEEQRLELPDAILWRVVARDASSSELGSATARASRSSP